MGQYYLIINIDKKEYIHPHKFNDGLKLLEFGCSPNGTMTALALLLSSGNGRGGGDLRVEDNDWTLETVDPPRVELVGSWGGDRIVISGDYSDDALFLEDRFLTKEEIDIIRNAGMSDTILHTKDLNLHNFADLFFDDISYDILDVMLIDNYIRSSFSKAGTWFKDGLPDYLKKKIFGNADTKSEKGKVMRPDMVIQFRGDNDS